MIFYNSIDAFCRYHFYFNVFWNTVTSLRPDNDFELYLNNTKKFLKQGCEDMYWNGLAYQAVDLHWCQCDQTVKNVDIKFVWLSLCFSCFEDLFLCVVKTLPALSKIVLCVWVRIHLYVRFLLGVDKEVMRYDQQLSQMLHSDMKSIRVDYWLQLLPGEAW